MRAEYGDLDISEAHDSDEWMAFHYNVQFPDRADPILTVTHVYSIDVHIQLCVSVLNSVTNRFKSKQTVLRFPCNGMDGMQ